MPAEPLAPKIGDENQRKAIIHAGLELVSRHTIH
jgi:hypothetical protein